jgi:hypothetical protein
MSHQPVFVKRRFLSQEERDWWLGILGNALSVLYCTFTFRDHVDSHQARKTFEDFIRILSSRYRENIAYIMAEEMTLSGLSTFRVRRHLHAVVLSNAPLSPDGFQECWDACVGNAKVRAYDLGQDGIGYILKMTASEYCDWKLSDNIWLFAPDHVPKNKRERHTLKHHLERKQARIAVR